MKRLSAILLLATFVFNLYGYRIVIDFINHGATDILQAKVDNKDYKEDQLISIKTPLNLPYYTNSPHFERTYGSIEINGIVYEYVKRRVFNDSLELLCIPNHVKNHLQDVSNDIARQGADLSGQQSKRWPVAIKIFFPNYFQQFKTIEVDPAVEHLITYQYPNSENIPTQFRNGIDHPPEINERGITHRNIYFN